MDRAFGFMLQLLDRKLSSLEAGTSAAAYNVEAELTHAEDLLSYANDILCTGLCPANPLH